MWGTLLITRAAFADKSQRKQPHNFALMSSYFSNIYAKNRGFSFEKPRFSYLNDIGVTRVVFYNFVPGKAGESPSFY